MSVDLGRDLSCTTSILTGRKVRGARLVAEAIYRRLTTPRGSLRGGEAEANYGLDLTRLIGSVSTASAAAALEGQIRAEAAKDERVDASSLTVTVVESSVGPAKAFTVAIEGDTSAGPFALKLAVNEVTVELLGLTASEVST